MAPPETSISRLCRFATVMVLLATLDAEAESKNGFVLDGALVPADEILHGGPGRDGIPSLDDPQFLPADEAGFMRSRDRVLGLELDGVARAYPIRILNYHEIVNDTFGDAAVVVTYCPLCNSGMAFNATIEGIAFTFGVSGLLYNSDVLLYDRQTGSLWSQIMQTAVTGPLKGRRLESIPMAHTLWRDWVARHPETEVLSIKTGFRRKYSEDPYPDYRRDSRLYFPVAEESSAYRRKSIVMGLEIDGHFKAYPFSELDNGPATFEDEFQGQTFEVRYDKKNKTASIIGDDGEEWPTLISFWFAWYAFHPDTEIYTTN